MATPKYDKLKSFSDKVGESIKIGLGSHPKDTDIIKKLRDTYISGAETLLGGSPDKEAVDALVSPSLSQLERFVKEYQDTNPLFVDFEQLEKAKIASLQIMQRYAAIVGKSEGKELGIEYIETDKGRDEEKFYATKVLEKLGRK